MRMVKICMLILCAVVLFAPPAAQSEMMPMPDGMMMMPGGMLVPAPNTMQQGDAMMMRGGMPMMMQQPMMRPDMMMHPGMKPPPPPPPMHKDGMRPMPPMPEHYTSPNGIMKHYSPEMQMMMHRRPMMMRPNMMMHKGMMRPNMMQNDMMMQKGMMKKGCCGGIKMNCPKMRMMQMQGMNPEMMKMRKMMNKPGMMNQDMMIKHDKMMMKQGMMQNDGTMMEPNMMMRPDMMQKGMMQHDMMHQGMMHKNMMMQKGVPFNNQMKRMPMMTACPMCAKVQSANMNPAMRAELMRTLTEFSMQNKPMYDELMMLRQQGMMMQRSALKSPANRATIDLKREKVRKALMENLTKQRMVLKERFGIDFTGRDLLMHRIHEMQMTNPGGVMMMHGTMMPMQNMQHGMMPMQHGMMNGYRSPQMMNPNYNQNYLLNAPMREGYSGETYK